MTKLLAAAGQGDLGATEHLVPLVYDELLRMAATKIGVEFRVSLACDRRQPLAKAFKPIVP
jgi:hypothetical protein